RGRPDSPGPRDDRPELPTGAHGDSPPAGELPRLRFPETGGAAGRAGQPMTSEPPERPGKTSLAVRILQRRIPIASGRLRAFLRIVAPAAGAPSGSATVALVTDGRMRTLNRDFRGLAQPT